MPYFEKVILALANSTQVNGGEQIFLQRITADTPQLDLSFKDGFELRAKLFGDSEWVSTKQIGGNPRLFIYTDSDFSTVDVDHLRGFARKHRRELVVRSTFYRNERSKQEKPLAFISFDSHDRDIALAISSRLQQMLCQVWYDEYSLRLGDNLRESIERGLKECKRCVLILSPNYLANVGWTKTEFDSVFGRQIIEGTGLLLPIWHNVDKNEIYAYSPSLVNVKAVKWEQGEQAVKWEQGEEAVCRHIYSAVFDD